MILAPPIYMMGKRSIEYIETTEAGCTIAGVAQRQFVRRRKDYQAVNLLDSEDLSQEIWFRLLERGIGSTPDRMVGLATKHAEVLARQGRRRRGIMETTTLWDGTIAAAT